MRYKRVLSIAGSDPSGGAGIQADLKTISACGCYASTAITAVVDENTLGVYGIHPIPASFVQGQIRSVLDDIGADAIKIGMLHSAEMVHAVTEILSRYPIRNIVLDPILSATSGDKLLQDEALSILKKELIPQVRIITPNIPEAEILLNTRITSKSDLKRVIKDLSCKGKVSVYLKAGHLSEETLTDVFYNAEADEIYELTSKRISTNNTHGTGCTLSSALASFLTYNISLKDAVYRTKKYMNQAIRQGAAYQMGKGHGPVHYFFDFWK